MATLILKAVRPLLGYIWAFLVGAISFVYLGHRDCKSDALWNMTICLRLSQGKDIVNFEKCKNYSHSTV